MRVATFNRIILFEKGQPLLLPSLHSLGSILRQGTKSMLARIAFVDSPGSKYMFCQYPLPSKTPPTKLFRQLLSNNVLTCDRLCDLYKEAGSVLYKSRRICFV